MKDREKRQVVNSLMLILQISLTMTVPILMCTVFGVFLGKRLNMPGLAIAGIGIGCVAGINGVYRQVKGFLKNPKSPGQMAREKDEAEKAKKDV